MEREAGKLLRDLERYRHLLSANADPRADAVLHELIAETEAGLRELNRRTGLAGNSN
jgi:hypothetical protein